MTNDPARSRTTTLGYQFPPAQPVTVPPAEQCSVEELLDLAAGAVNHADQLWALLGSRDHVRSICRLLIEAECRYAGDIRRLQNQLAEQQAATAQAHEMWVAELAHATEMKRHSGQLSAENRLLRAQLASSIQAGFERLTVTVTGETYAKVNERLTAAVADIDGRFDRSEER